MTAFLWPTKSNLVFHLFVRSITWAVGALLLIACALMIRLPSGDQPKRKTWVVPVHCLNGSSIVFSKLQSEVFQIFKVLSSDLKKKIKFFSQKNKILLTWEAKYSPIGSQTTPLTRPLWAFILLIISGNFKAFQIIIVLSTLQLARKESVEDQAKSSMSKF